jgi:hypothetical protein
MSKNTPPENPIGQFNPIAIEIEHKRIDVLHRL